MLWRLETRPAIAEKAAGAAVEPGHLDQQPAVRGQQIASGLERSQRVVVVFEEMPHGDEVETFRAEILLVQQAAIKARAGKSGQGGKVLEVEADGYKAQTLPHALQKGAAAATDVEQFLPRGRREETAHHGFLVAVDAAHCPFVKRLQDAPGFALAVGDVVVAIKFEDEFGLEARQQVGQATIEAGDETVDAHLAGEVVFGQGQWRKAVAAAEVTGDFFKTPGVEFRAFRQRAQWGASRGRQSGQIHKVASRKV